MVNSVITHSANKVRIECHAGSHAGWIQLLDLTIKRLIQGEESLTDDCHMPQTGCGITDDCHRQGGESLTVVTCLIIDTTFSIVQHGMKVMGQDLPMHSTLAYIDVISICAK